MSMQMPNPTYNQSISIADTDKRIAVYDIYFSQSMNVSGYKAWSLHCPILVRFI